MKKRIFSILLALVLCLSLLPTAVFAGEGDTTTTLTEDQNSTFTVNAGENVILDLNGHNITVASGHAIVNKGTLTIKGEGKVSATGSGSVALVNHPGASVTLNGGTYESAHWYVLKNYGTMKIDGAVTVQKPADAGKGDLASLITNGWYDGAAAQAHEYDVGIAHTGNAVATLTIEAGNFVGKSGAGSSSVVKNDDYGVLTINGGTFDSTANTKASDATTILNNNVATINGGTFKGSYPISNAYYNDTYNKGELTITNGTFTGSTALLGKGNDKNNGKLTIKGGTFTAPVMMSGDGSKWYAVEVEGGTFSDNLVNSAIEKAASGATIKLGADVTSTVTIPADKNITLDLNGKKLTNTTGQHTIIVDKDATLTVTGTGTVDNVSNQKAAIYNKGTVTLNGGTYTRSKENGNTKTADGGNSWYVLENHGTMTVNAPTKVEGTSGFSSLFENGYRSYNTETNDGVAAPELTINGGTFSGGLNTIKNDEGATLTIKDGTFTNYKQACVANWNKATIEGGTFDGTEAESTILNGAYNNYATGELTISGGTFTGDNTIAHFNGYENADGITVSGGIFTTDPGAYAADGYIGTKNSNGTYGVVENNGNLTSGVYTSDPTGSLANGYYVSSVDRVNGLWTVSRKVTPSKPAHDVNVTNAINGSVSVNQDEAREGTIVTVTVDAKTGYTLDTLTVTDKNGNEIKVTHVGGNKYSFVMPATEVTVRATVTDGTNTGFVDVPAGKYFYNAVNWAVENGITSGTDATHFSPYASCTRGQLVTFLWRVAGEPAAKNAEGFSDVAATRSCAKAVLWAAENGIVTGYSDGTFRPDQAVTRQQVAAILYRYAKFAKMDVSVGEDTNILSFNDATSISEYAISAFQWAVGEQVITGNNGSLLPHNTCTRAQIVTMLYRLLAK